LARRDWRMEDQRLASDAKKAIVRAYVDAFNAFDMTRLRQLFASDARIHGVLGHGNLDDVEPIWRELHEGLNTSLEILGMVAEANEVVVRYREVGRFIGAFRGLAGTQPTGRSYEIVAIEWFLIDNGRISCRWAARDSGAITRQVLGA
jgi:predicted ester cyclase